MPFYSAIAGSDVVRKADALMYQDDPAHWLVVSAMADVAVYFELLSEETDPLGRMISALTSSATYHVEMWLGPSAPSVLVSFAESKLGEPYDYEGALKAWDDSGYHTPNREFCSGLAYELLTLVPIEGLQPYPNPGKLLSQLPAMLGQPQPKLATRDVALNDADLDYLQQLVAAGKLATGRMQEVLAALSSTAPGGTA